MTNANDAKHYTSTSALAKKISKDSGEIFSLLSDGGWIVKVNKRWQLTNKGRFEGGILLEHPKFGEYVAWPEDVQSHPIFDSLAESSWTASKIASRVDLPARVVNLIFQHLGFVASALKGWQLTAAGRELGGKQCYSEASGIPYASWPESILSNQALKDTLDTLHANNASLSGRACASKELQLIESWLYLNGLHYCLGDSAVNRARGALGGCDFYFPHQRVSVFYWPQAEEAEAVAKRLTAIEALQHQDFIELRFEDGLSMKKLDEVLPKLLLQRGILTY